MLVQSDAPQPASPPPDRDDRVIMRGLDWWQYEVMLAVRGDSAGVRLAYLEGDLEIMSPGRTHEYVKKSIARLLEAYAEEQRIFFDGYGSLTMKNQGRLRGAEPDECYVVGSARDQLRQPDLAIEVIVTSGGIDKRAIYAGLAVQELWEWRDGRIQVLVLEGEGYREVPRSVLLPALDLGALAGFVASDDQTEAVRAFRRTLRAGS
jgi:Uma2 family endonuclease